MDMNDASLCELNGSSAVIGHKSSAWRMRDMLGCSSRLRAKMPAEGWQIVVIFRAEPVLTMVNLLFDDFAISANVRCHGVKAAEDGFAFRNDFSPDRVNHGSDSRGPFYA